jgi:hypothetical protein
MDGAGNVTATVQPGAAAGIAAVQLPNTTYTSGTFQFFNSNNFTFLSTTGQGIVGSFSTSQSVQTQASGNIPRTGFTTNATAGVVLVGTNDTGGLNLGVPAWITTYVAQTTQPVAFSGANGSANFSTLSFKDTNGLQWSTSAGPAIYAVYTVPTVTNSSWTVSDSATSLSISRLAFTNSNGMTMTLSTAAGAATVIGSYTVPVSSNGILDVSTATNAGTATSRFAAHDHQHRGVRGFAAQAVASTFFGDMVLSAGNNITLSTGGNTTAGSIAIHGVAAQTVQPVNASAANGSFNFSTISFSNVNGVSFATAAGPAIQASIATTYAGTGVTTASTAGSDLAATLNTSGLSLGIPKWLTVAAGGGDGYNIVSMLTSTSGGGTLGATFSTLSGSIGFMAGSNITLSQDSNTIKIIGPTPGAAQESNWMTLLGANVAGNSSASGSTIGLSGLNMTLSGTNNSQIVLSVPATSSISATGIVSISVNANTISIGAPGPAFSAGGGSSSAQTLSFSDNIYGSWTNTAGQIAISELRGSFFAVSNTTQSSSGTQNLDAISFNGAGLVSVGVTGGSVVISGIPAFSADASSTFKTLTFQNTSNVSFSNNAGAIRIQHNLAGTGTAITGRASITLNSTGLSFNGTNLAGVGTGTAVTGRASITLTADSSSVAFSFNGNGIAGTGFTTGTTTGAWTGLSMVMPFLTRMILPADEQVTAVVAPTNASMSFRYVEQQAFLTASRMDMLIGMSFSTTAGAGTQTLQESRYAVIYTKNGASLSSLSSGSTQTTWTMASNSAGQTQLSQAAVRYVSVPINVNMQPGEYYVGVNYITAGTAVSLTQSMYGGNDIQTASNYAEMGSTTNATTGQLWGAMGCYSAASTGMPAALSLSAILQTGAPLSAANIAVVFRNA